MLPPPRVGGIELAEGSVGEEASARATPIMPMKGLSGNLAAPPSKAITPWPSSIGVNTETLPQAIGSAVPRPSVDAAGITCSRDAPSGAAPSAVSASAPLPCRLETTP